MDADFVATHVFFEQELGTLNDARADDEECSVDVLLRQEVEEFPIIQTYLERFRDFPEGYIRTGLDK